MSEAKRLLRQALDELQEGCRTLEDAVVQLRVEGHGWHAERISGYVLSHIAIALSEEHGYCARSMCTLAEEIENIGNRDY